MADKFQTGQRVSHPAKRLKGVIESVQHDPRQVTAPNETYTVRWDGDPMAESTVYPKEIEVDDQPD
jgi:hypothetical protein